MNRQQTKYDIEQQSFVHIHNININEIKLFAGLPISISEEVIIKVTHHYMLFTTGCIECTCNSRY